MRALLFVLSVLLLAAPALAVEPGEMLDDPVLEQRARDLSAEIRCVVCQNESIDSSNAVLAHELRVLVRGRSEVQTSELQSLMRSTYAVFRLQNKRRNQNTAKKK